LTILPAKLFAEGIKAVCIAFDTALMRSGGMTLPGNGWPVVGCFIVFERAEKSPFR
jgi:hypothetical protein